MEVDYFLTDHLGSVRVIVDGNGVVKERNDYYPFGARHVRGDYPQLAANRFKYNGKEEQMTGDLEYLDYGARMYDSGLGRWFGMDLMSEDYYSWSVYNYCLNQPVRFVDPNGLWVDEWNLNVITGEFTWFSNLGGDEFQFVNFVSSHSNGGLKWLGSSFVQGSTIYSGPIADNYSGDFSFGISNKDLWSDIPQEYQGHYLAWDLKLRYCYENMKDQTKINSIRLQEIAGLDRREMIWNTSDEYKKIVSKYKTDASFVLAYEYGMMPLPVGSTDVITYIQGSLTAGKSSYFGSLTGFKGSQYFKNIAVYSTQPILSNNPWIRFLQEKKGTFKGSNWLNDARQAYYKIKH